MAPFGFKITVTLLCYNTNLEIFHILLLLSTMTVTLGACHNCNLLSFFNLSLYSIFIFFLLFLAPTCKWVNK